MKEKKGIVISVCNQKGGVGKTTSTINIADCFARKGKKVLVVDFDPQGSLTEALQIPRNDEHNVTRTINCFIKYKREEAAKVLQKSIVSFADGFDVLPSHYELGCMEQMLVSVNAREFILKKLIGEIGAGYDIILIDCPPTFSILSINALVASKYVLIPVKAQFLDFKGFNLLYKNICNYVEDLNGDLKILGVFSTFYDGRLKMAKKIDGSLVALREKLLLPVLETRISQSTVAAEASLKGKPIYIVSKQSRLACEYMALTEEIDRLLDNK